MGVWLFVVVCFSQIKLQNTNAYVKHDICMLPHNVKIEF